LTEEEIEKMLPKKKKLKPSNAALHDAIKMMLSEPEEEYNADNAAVVINRFSVKELDQCFEEMLQSGAIVRQKNKSSRSFTLSQQ
jgi:hypothetical protein